MISRLLSRRDLQELGIKYTPQHLARLIKAGKFPRPLKPSGAPNGQNAWFEHEISKHLEMCARENAGPDQGSASACQPDEAAPGGRGQPLEESTATGSTPVPSAKRREERRR
jgi:predicted DNA-binding transcriptional regulator AlpA